MHLVKFINLISMFITYKNINSLVLNGFFAILNGILYIGG